MTDTAGQRPSLADTTPLAPDAAPVWYSCLVAERSRIGIKAYADSSTRKRRHKGSESAGAGAGSARSKKSARTHIFPTHAPIGMVEAMQKSDSKKPFTYGRRSGRRSRTAAKPPKRGDTPGSTNNSELVAVVWPFASEEDADRFSTRWAKCSRSLSSRGISGAVIASTRNLNVTVNWYAMFELNEEDVHIGEVRDPQTNALLKLEFRMRDANKNPVTVL